MRQEGKIQEACVTWFRYNHYKYVDLLFHVPNGGYRTKRTAALMKREGVVAGVADLLLLVPNDTAHGLCVEVKTAKGRQTERQKLWQQAVIAQGYEYHVVRSLDEFIAVVDGYLT